MVPISPVDSQEIMSDTIDIIIYQQSENHVKDNNSVCIRRLSVDDYNEPSSEDRVSLIAALVL